jgi:hypothetical protein
VECLLRKRIRKDLGHAALLHEGAVDAVPTEQDNGDQPVDAAGDRGADHGEDDAGIDGMADRPVRSCSHEFGCWA